MNLQERLERMLDERRSYVVGHEPGPQAAMEGLLMTCAEGALHAENQHERDGWLVRLCGLALYVLHPEDDLAHVTVDALPLPPRQEPFAALAKAFGEHKPGGILIGEPGSARPQGDEPLPEYADEHEVPFTVHKQGDGRWRRKPRPDRV